MNPLIKTFVEVELNDADTPQKARAAFLKVRETLTRVGVASKSDMKRVLYQSCHIFHKQGRYFITHFKEMMALDGRDTDFNEDDLARRNTIVKLLEQWKLVTVVSPRNMLEPSTKLRKKIKVIHFDEKHLWKLEPKYRIGVPK